METNKAEDNGNRRWKTQLDAARKGIITDEMKFVAEDEYLSPKFVLDEIAAGRLIIPVNKNHNILKPRAIGISTRCKINANIGNSAVSSGLDEELNKLHLCVDLGSDAVMDLSTGERIDEIRKAMVEHSPIPLGTVPIYEAMENVEDAVDLSPRILLDVIEKQARQGVDFMTIHAGILWRFMPLAANRLIGIVSRGGSILAKWMMTHKKENPLYTHFDEVLDICGEYDVSLSLGDGLRPGCLADASDEAQFAELEILGELAQKCWDKDVQVMIEGPGHVPFDQIEMNVQKQIEICKGAPFYVLGPIVTDIAPGYDHITSSIGATMAAFAGASMLCYVTPSEHLGLPNLKDVREGIIAYKIAAHAADIARKRPHVRDRDDQMSKARYSFDWDTQFKLALDSETAKSKYDASVNPDALSTKEYCSMCGPKFCAMKISQEAQKAAKDQS